MSEWKECTLGEVLNLRRGYDLPHSEMKEGIIPVAGSNGIIGTHNIATEMEPCITVGRSGSAGSTFYYDKAWAHNTTLYIDDFKGNDPKYLYYLLLSLPLKKMAGGSAVPSLNRNHIHPLNIKFPCTIETQQRIASILSSLDSKIECNRKICANLEAQAQALFKHWFIDFAPFKDGKFVESELGMIPEGWRVGRLGEIAEITMGQSPSSSSYNEESEGVIFYQGRTEFGFRFPGVRLYTTEPKRFAKPLSTLLSVRAPVGDVNVATERCCIGRGLASIESRFSHNSFIYYLLLSLKRRFDVYNGEGTVFGSINKDTLTGMKIVIPPMSRLQDFEEIAREMDNKIFEAFQEINRLSTLRDTLLPKLMSGQIKL